MDTGLLVIAAVIVLVIMPWPVNLIAIGVGAFFMAKLRSLTE